MTRSKQYNFDKIVQPPLKLFIAEKKALSL